MDADTFDFPTSVTRSTDLAGSAADTRTGHHVFAHLTPEEVERGRAAFGVEWNATLRGAGFPGPPAPDQSWTFEATDLLRQPVARATCAALLDGIPTSTRDRVADEVLAWIDALGPVIARASAPRRWSRVRRTERRARIALEESLTAVLTDCGITDTPPVVATMLAAGIQVPIAAGSWLLVHLAAHSNEDPDPLNSVWETLRLTPPTWVTARVTTAPVEFDEQLLPAREVVLVSPLLLGRLPELAPDEPAQLDTFCPDRWLRDDVRPGAWLPFGAGAHACPGRTLGLALLRELATWAGQYRITLASSVTIDQSRGIRPSPARVTVRPREEVQR